MYINIYVTMSVCNYSQVTSLKITGGADSASVCISMCVHVCLCLCARVLVCLVHVSLCYVRSFLGMLSGYRTKIKKIKHYDEMILHTFSLNRY